MRFKISRSVLGLALLLAMLITLPMSAAADEAAAAGSTPRTLLFVDDHHILYRAGTERVWHAALPHAENPLVREDQPWEMAIGWTSVHRDAATGKYQLWYQAYAGGRDARKSRKCVVCVAESADGVHFTKPPVGVHDFQNTRGPNQNRITNTNIVLPGSGGYGDRYDNSVLFDAADPDPARRYKMLYTDFVMDEDGQEWPGLCAAFSPDGLYWTNAKENPLQRIAYGGRSLQPPFAEELAYSERWDQGKNFRRKTWALPLSMSDAVDVMWDPVRGVYAAYGKCWLNGPDGGLAWKHAMARIESRDFLAWSPPEIVCAPDEFDPPNTEFHTSPVFYHAGVYFCLNQIMRSRAEATATKADLMHVELMLSRDGLHWERPARQHRFIPTELQTFTTGGIFTNSTPIVLEDEIRFYYGGYTSGAIGAGSALDSDEQQSGVGLATLPLDRFAGVRPLKLNAQSTLRKPLVDVGQITLKPLDLTGVSELTVNADASAGSVRVEMLNEQGFRVRGFSRDDSVSITGDGLRHAVRWQTKSLPDLPPGRYLLRLHLDNAEVFAVSYR